MRRKSHVRFGGREGCKALLYPCGSPRALLRHEVASFTARHKGNSCDLAWCGTPCSRTVGASLATAG